MITRWIIFIGVLILSLVLQHTRKSMKILMGILSTALIMSVGYGWKAYDTKWNQMVVVIVCFWVGVLLNSVWCKEK